MAVVVAGREGRGRQREAGGPRGVKSGVWERICEAGREWDKEGQRSVGERRIG